MAAGSLCGCARTCRRGFAIHETATISTMWPAMPCFSNLVLFDPLKTTHRMDAIVGELAERWSLSCHDHLSASSPTIASIRCVVLSGSKSTRLLKQGMAGHMVEIVAVSCIANPLRQVLAQPQSEPAAILGCLT